MKNFELKLLKHEQDKLRRVVEDLKELNGLNKLLKEEYYGNKDETNFHNVWILIDTNKRKMRDALEHVSKAHGYEANNLLAKALTPQLKFFLTCCNTPPKKKH